VSGDFPVQLATRLPDWSAGGLLWCNAARLSVVVSFSKSHAPDTRATCCGNPGENTREDVTRMLRGNGSRGIPA